jgi:starch phosphorylase
MTQSSEDDRRLCNLRARARERMVERMREQDLPVADSDALWIGWAGRMTATNRPNVLLRDLARLERLIDDPMNAVRIAIAGEPGDAAGHAALAQIIDVANNPRFDGRVVYVSGAGAEAILAEGVDLWLGASTTDEFAVTAVRSGAIHVAMLGDEDHDARAIYELLERDIVPLFYAWNNEGVPLRWLERVRASMI